MGVERNRVLAALLLGNHHFSVKSKIVKESPKGFIVPFDYGLTITYIKYEITRFMRCP